MRKITKILSLLGATAVGVTGVVCAATLTTTKPTNKTTTVGTVDPNDVLIVLTTDKNTLYYDPLTKQSATLTAKHSGSDDQSFIWSVESGPTTNVNLATSINYTTTLTYNAPIYGTSQNIVIACALNGVTKRVQITLMPDNMALKLSTDKTSIAYDDTTSIITAILTNNYAYTGDVTLSGTDAADFTLVSSSISNCTVSMKSGFAVGSTHKLQFTAGGVDSNYVIITIGDNQSMSLAVTGTMKVGGGSGADNKITVNVTSHDGLNLLAVDDSNLSIDGGATNTYIKVNAPTTTTTSATYTLEINGGNPTLGVHTVTMDVDGVESETTFTVSSADQRTHTIVSTDFGSASSGIEVDESSFLIRNTYDVTLYLHFGKNSNYQPETFDFNIPSGYAAPSDDIIRCATDVGSSWVPLVSTTSKITFAIDDMQISPNYTDLILGYHWTTADATWPVSN